MPLKLNVGLSRKVGEDHYGSRGASVNIELEAESALVNEPAKLRDRIRQIFGLVRESLVEELNGNGSGQNGTGQNGTNRSAGAPNGSVRSNGNGNGIGNGRAGGRGGSRPATESQVKAIFAIAKGQGLEVSQLVQERFQVNRPDDLSIKQASQLIDELKSNGRG